MMLEAHVVFDKWSFEKKKLLQNFQKKEFFEFIEKFSRLLFLNLIHKDNLYYLLYSSTNHILENLVPEILTKCSQNDEKV